MDDILSLLQDFDLAKFLPAPESFVRDVELFMRVAVMAGPLVLLGLGLWYYLAPPKEANYSVGFRTYWGMGSVEAWQFTQKLAGMYYSVLGTALTVIMSLICNGFRAMNPMTMANVAIICVVIECILILGIWAYIKVKVKKTFDKEGNRRKP